MTISDLGAIGEFLGSMFVLVSLIYIVIQVRDTKRSARASVQLQYGESQRAAAAALVSNPELFQLYSRGCKDYRNLSLEEKERFDFTMHSLFSVFATGFYASETDPTLMKRVQPIIDGYINRPGVLEWWQSGGPSASSEGWVGFVNSRIAKLESPESK